VLGDNRSVSVDSRSFGEVNKIQIRGKIIFCFDF
jgi:type IV secretory pathway protease TraF